MGSKSDISCRKLASRWVVFGDGDGMAVSIYWEDILFLEWTFGGDWEICLLALRRSALLVTSIRICVLLAVLGDYFMTDLRKSCWHSAAPQPDMLDYINRDQDMYEGYHDASLSLIDGIAVMP